MIYGNSAKQWERPYDLDNPKPPNTSFHITGKSYYEIGTEEEEKEEHKQDLLEVLVNNTDVILYLTVKIKEPILEPIITEVSTPPPEFS